MVYFVPLKPTGRWKALTLILLLLVGIPAEADVIVTGNPASAAFLSQLLEAEVERDLGPGEQVTVQGTVVRNQELPVQGARVLAFSDHPEEVERPGLLFSGGLLAHKPVRLQYYHLSALDGDARLRLKLSNPGPTPARLLVVRAHGGPSEDYFQAGHANNVRFLARLAHGEGQVLEVPARSELELVEHPFPRGSVVSGTVQFQLLKGEPLRFGLFATDPQQEQPGMGLLSDPEDVHARGFYPVADHLAYRGHVVGEGETHVALGAVHQDTFLGNKALRGNYGVLYRVRLLLKNPGARPARVWAQVNPRGGEATATFWLFPGGLVEVPRTAARELSPVAEWELAPGEEREVELWTMPEGASNYPVRIVVSSELFGQGTKVHSWNSNAGPIQGDWWSQ